MQLNKPKKALAVLLSYIGTEKFLNEIDYDVLNVVLELMNKISLYNGVFLCLYYLIIDYSSFVMFNQNLS